LERYFAKREIFAPKQQKQTQKINLFFAVGLDTWICKPSNHEQKNAHSTAATGVASLVHSSDELARVAERSRMPPKLLSSNHLNSKRNSGKSA